MNKFKQFIVDLGFNDEAYYIKKSMEYASKNITILDVGCGYGRIIKLFNSYGFYNILGIDTNKDIIRENIKNGISCIDLESFNIISSDEKKYDLIIFSHIVEHFEHTSLKSFLEYYFQFLNEDGKILISTPLFQQSFYNDFDHVKPYYPIGFDMVFGNHNAQVQYYSPFILKLKNLYFYKSQYRLRFYRSLYIKSSKIPILINLFLNIIFILSKGTLGEKIGWIGLYDVEKHNY